jgi:hypothetical protein
VERLEHTILEFLVVGRELPHREVRVLLEIMNVLENVVGMWIGRFLRVMKHRVGRFGVRRLTRQGAPTPTPTADIAGQGRSQGDPREGAKRHEEHLLATTPIPASET